MTIINLELFQVRLLDQLILFQCLLCGRGFQELLQLDIHRRDVCHGEIHQVISDSIQVEYEGDYKYVCHYCGMWHKVRQ